MRIAKMRVHEDASTARASFFVVRESESEKERVRKLWEGESDRIFEKLTFVNSFNESAKIGGMNAKVKKGGSIEQVGQSEEEIKKGAWSLEEDTILQNYVATHGHGLKRSGKSCRLRWLNYLRPDVRRGNITVEEQITILELHSRWGNRWSKIARHLPGRTDNEIKNYWRTRVIKQARNLKCDVESKHFQDALRYVWMPRLVERIQPPPAPTQLHPKPTTHQQHGLGLGLGLGLHHSDPGSTPMPPVPCHTLTFHDHNFQQGNTILPLSAGDFNLIETLWDDHSMWLMQQLSHDLEIKDNFLA
ncbi:hypothetical protein VNO78_18158 [Psophocarpus tetragonolobus]|uniref:Uncharacterized protein n=1 Tax=Psophocarpus tetragonolobus TaxID=3891 RepID=A0AAN9SK32_PSOTE